MALIRLHVAHASEGRLRLRTMHVGAVEETFLEQLRERIAEYAPVREVRTSVRTGSVLVIHDGSSEPLLAHLRKLDAVELVPPSAHTPMLRLQAALQETEARLAKRTQGTITLGSLTFALTTIAGIWQTGQGRLLPAGMTLLEYALNAMHREAERERAEPRTRG